MLELWQTIVQLVDVLLKLVGEVGQLALLNALLLFWLAWATFAINWKKAWSVLAQGAWAPLVLLVLASAMVWSQLAPSNRNFLGIVNIQNFWWQLGAMSALLGLTLFCGWLQGKFHWAPAELDLEPPVAGGHGHGHDHAHH